MSITTRTPFVVADIARDEDTEAEITYIAGWGCSGTGHNEVLQRIRYPDGAEAEFVIMRGMSGAKAQAIAMILNAPEM